MENKLIWKTEVEMQEELKKRIDSWKQGDSKDGFVLRAKGKFVYRGIAYLINVLRYFNHTDKFVPMGRERISDSHANVEYPDETQPIVDIVSGIEDVYEFLYHDTNHSHNDNQTIEEQIKECHDLAKADIDSLLDGEISKKLDIAIDKLQEIKTKIVDLSDVSRINNAHRGKDE